MQETHFRLPLQTTQLTAWVRVRFALEQGCTAPGVRLYFDALLLKPPGAKGAGWHKDMLQSPFKSTTQAAGHFVTIWIPLEDVPPDHGAVRFASGSQKYVTTPAYDHVSLLHMMRSAIV